MPEINKNFSKIVRSLLLDVDVVLDQLVEIGYYSKSQRAFLDKFLYKSEDALLAVSFMCGPPGNELLATKLASPEEAAHGLLTSPSRSENSVSNLATHAFPHLSIVTDHVKSEESGLTDFVQRCNARNFSVKASGMDAGKKSPNKGKGSDYISTLEPIVEAFSKGDATDVEVKLDDQKLVERVNHDTIMMIQGADSLARDLTVKTVDYKTNIPTEVLANAPLHKLEQTTNESIDIKPGNVQYFVAKVVDFTAAAAESATSTESALKPIKVEHIEVESVNMKDFKDAPGSCKATVMKLAEAGVADGNHDSQNEIELSPPSDPIEGLETNAWGKPTKSNSAVKKEGAVVGGSVKPLGIDNKGRAMMEKMGWSKGSGLGKHREGILEPVTQIVKNNKTGLRSLNEKKTSSRLNLTSENISSHVPVEKQPFGSSPQTSDWENSPELTVEQIQSAADWAASMKFVEKMNQADAEAAKGRIKEPFKGIQALYIRESDNPGPEKTLEFRSKIQITNEYKTTKHYPGVVIKALSSQKVDFLNQKNGFKVSCGNHLEILRAHQQDQYHVYNFSQKKRGIVKISLLEIMEEFEGPIVYAATWASIPAAATH